MSDPRNAAHDKRVSQEKKHQGAAAEPAAPAVAEEAVPNDSPATPPPAALEGSLVVLAQLKDLESHSRAHLERLAALALTVEDESKQEALVAPLGEVYSAQSTFQTKLTALIVAYKAECDHMQA